MTTRLWWVSFLLIACVPFTFQATVSGTTQQNTNISRSSNSEVGVYGIGVVYQPGNDTGSIKDVVEYAVNQINGKASTLSRLGLYSISIPASARYEAINAAEALQKEGVVGLVGPATSSQALVMSEVGTVYSLPILSSSAPSEDLSDSSTYPYFSRTILSTDRRISITLAVLRDYYGWNDIAVIVSTGTDTSSLGELLFSDAIESGMKIVSFLYFSLGEDLAAVLSLTQETGARIILPLISPDEFIGFIDALYKANYYGHPYVFVYPNGIVTPSLLVNIAPQYIPVLRGSLATIPTPFENPDDARLEGLTQYLQGQGYQSLGPFDTFTFDAVYAYAYALDGYNKPTGSIRLSERATDGNTTSQSVSENEDNEEENAYEGYETETVDNTTEPTTTDQGQAVPRLTQQQKINGTKLRDDLRLQVFAGISGEISFYANGDRKIGSITINNFVVESGEEIALIAVVKTVAADKNQTVVVTEIAPTFFPDGTTTGPDSVPKTAVTYYDCELEETFTDVRGVIVFNSSLDDPRYIDNDRYCDGAFDCDNLSDEGFDCSPSLLIAEIVIGVITGILMLIVIVAWLILMLNRHRGRIRASGSIFLTICAFSSLVGLGSVFCFYGKDNTPSCVLQAWLPTIFSGIIIGALAAKQYRVWKLFGNKDLTKKVIVRERSLYLIVLGVIVPEIIVLVVWTSIDMLHVDLDDDDNIGCYSDNRLLFVLLIVCFKGVFLVVSSLFAIITHKYPSAFSESKLIAISLYHATFISAVLLPLYFSITSDRFLSWIIIICLILLFFFNTFCILSIPKIYALYVVDRHKSENEKNRLPKTRKTKDNSDSSTFS